MIFSHLHIDFRFLKKKLHFQLKKQNCQLSHIFPLFLPRSSDMIKPLLELCRADPGDAFTYLSWSHIMSTSYFRSCEKICQISFVMHILLRETSKRSLKSPILKPKTFFSSNSKNFSIIKNHIDLKSGDVLWPSWTGFHFELWCLDAFSRKSPKNTECSYVGHPFCV